MRKDLFYNTNSKAEIMPITDDIRKVIKESGIKDGIIYIYSLHTTLGLAIQEAAEPNLCQDIIDQLTKIIDDDGRLYKHTCAKHPSGTCEADKANAPSHIRQLLTNQSLVLDIKNGGLVLGRWQDIALIELDGPRKDRQVHIKIIKD